VKRQLIETALLQLGAMEFSVYTCKC